mgnify:FL=1
MRTPILHVERTPIVEKTEPSISWDEVYDSLVNYIKFAAKQVANQYSTSVVNSPEDLFQEGQLLLYHCYTVYIVEQGKGIDEFNTVFKTSLWRKLRSIAKKSTVIQVNIEDAYELGYSDDVVENIYQEYQLQQIASMLESDPVALTIIKEFVNPSSRTLWEAEMDVSRKDCIKEQELVSHAPKAVVIKGVHIQRALEIPKYQFNEKLGLVKTAVSKVYGRSKSDELFKNIG